MKTFAHEKVLFFLALLAFGKILERTDEAHEPVFRPGALEISKSVSLYPADLSIPPYDAVFVGKGLRIGRVERYLVSCQKTFPIARMHPFQELLERPLVLGNVQNLLATRIPQSDIAPRIVLPSPEQSGVEGQLQTIFAFPLGSIPKMVRCAVRLCAVFGPSDRTYSVSELSAYGPSSYPAQTDRRSTP